MNNLMLRALRDIYRLSRRFVLISVIAGLFSAVYPLISIEISRRIVEQLSTQNDATGLMQFIVIGLSLVLISQTISGLFNYTHAFEESEFRMKLEIARNLKGIDMAFHYAEDPAIKDLRRKLTIIGYSGIPSLEMIAGGIREMVQHLTSVLGATILILPAFLYHSGSVYDAPAWLLLLFGLLALSIYIPHKNNVKQNKKLEQMYQNVNHANTVYNYIMDLLFIPATGKEIRLYKQQPGIEVWFKEVSRIDGSVAAIIKQSTEAWGKTELISTAGNQVVMLCLYLFVGIKAIVGQLPMGHIVAATAALTVLISALPRLISMFSLTVSDSTGLELHYQYMDLPEQKQKGSIPVEKRLDYNYALSAKRVAFTYPGTDKQILQDINVQFEVGKSYAIVGENGSGKTTFIKLLTRLYDPDQGEILLNNISAKKYDTDEYYSLFNVVFQDFDLFSFKLAETIATDEKYDESRILQILKDVGFWKRYKKMPKGLDTSLNKEFDAEGVILSGGEQQKLALARALYNDGPIYILDEPTAALDPISEYEIYQKFHEMTRGKTTLIISHRLSSCRFSDEILVFDQGKIVQQGSHDELVSKPGKYADLWQAQARHYQAEEIDLTRLGMEEIDY